MSRENQVFMRYLLALVSRSEYPVFAQTEKITHKFITALSFGKQHGILGRNFYNWDSVYVAGTKYGGTRLFAVGNMYLAYIFPCNFPRSSSSLYLVLAVQNFKWPPW